MPYIPPNARKNTNKAKEVADFKVVENEFPQLGASGGAKPVWTGRSFAALAEDWSKVPVEKKEEEEKEKEPDAEFVLPRFNNVRRFVEEDDTEPEQKVEAEWKFVAPRKFHVKKEVDLDILFPDPDKESNRQETVWKDNGPALHETVWDERRG